MFGGAQTIEQTKVKFRELLEITIEIASLQVLQIFLKLKTHRLLLSHWIMLLN